MKIESLNTDTREYKVIDGSFKNVIAIISIKLTIDEGAVYLRLPDDTSVAVFVIGCYRVGIFSGAYMDDDEVIETLLKHCDAETIKRSIKKIHRICVSEENIYDT